MRSSINNSNRASLKQRETQGGKQGAKKKGKKQRSAFFNPEGETKFWESKGTFKPEPVRRRKIDACPIERRS